MKIDLICAWPIHLDYPLFRKFIHDNRFRFNKIVIVFTNMNAGEDKRQFLREVMAKDEVSAIDNNLVPGDKDWRDVAMNLALDNSDSEWIWFTEQDFFIDKPEKFWQGIEDCVQNGADAIVYNQDNKRLHPCCFFVKRFILNNFTDRFFGIVPEHDHFWKVLNDLDQSEEVSLFKLGEELAQDGDFHHMNGLSQNLYLESIGQKANYQPKAFKEYLKKIKELDE